MTRVVEVAGMRIEINRELQASIDAPAKIEQDVAPLEYISQDDYSCQNDVPIVIPTSAMAEFTAAITVLDAVDPSEVPLWTVGFAQNVVAYERTALYGNGRINEDFQYFSPLRDSDIGSLPFYALGGGATEELSVGTPLDVICTDDPRWPLPDAITGRGIDAPLARTTGGNRFMTWLMLARLTDTDRRVVLLGKVPWSVNLRTEASPSGLQWSTPVTTQLGLPEPLFQVYDAATIPPVGNGQVVPDLRKLEAHTYVQGHLSQDQGEPPLLVEWIYNDDECATPWRQIVDPVTVPNWLAGEGPGADRTGQEG